MDISRILRAVKALWRFRSHRRIGRWSNRRAAAIAMASRSIGYALGVAMLIAAPAQARDPLLLRQALLPDEAGVAFMLIDRDQVMLVRGTKAKGIAQVVEVLMAAEPTLTLELRCIDQAAASQVMEALRPGGPATLDVSGRCRL